jgi:methionine-gamma-lyase
MARFSTRAILAATRSPEVNQVPSAVPIYQAAAFSTADAGELGDVLTGARPGYAYSRIDNPTTAALAAAVAELEGAEAGLAFATGMAAIHAAIVSVVRAGQTIVATQAVYGTTRDLLVRVLAGPGHRDRIRRSHRSGGRGRRPGRTGAPILYVETISNPTIIVSDIAALAEIAHRHGARLLVDNTFASPFACRPIEHGADLVMHSATKYLSGHADVLAGVVVGSRERSMPCRPILVDVGGALAPIAAFLVLRGLPTLALRMERHSETALDLATWLAEGQDGVERVHYPGLPQDPPRPRRPAAGRLRRHARLRAERRARGRSGIPRRHAHIAERTASLGAFRTITTAPPSTTHRQLDEAALRAAGIAPGCSAARSVWRTSRICARTSSEGSPRPPHTAG